jgi:hypothetical protein
MTDLRDIAEKTGRWRVLIWEHPHLGPVFRDNEPGDPLPEHGASYGQPRLPMREQSR